MTLPDRRIGIIETIRINKLTQFHLLWVEGVKDPWRFRGKRAQDVGGSGTGSSKQGAVKAVSKAGCRPDSAISSTNAAGQRALDCDRPVIFLRALLSRCRRCACSLFLNFISEDFLSPLTIRRHFLDSISLI